MYRTHIRIEPLALEYYKAFDAWKGVLQNRTSLSLWTLSEGLGLGRTPVGKGGLRELSRLQAVVATECTSSSCWNLSAGVWAGPMMRPLLTSSSCWQLTVVSTAFFSRSTVCHHPFAHSVGHPVAIWKTTTVNTTHACAAQCSKVNGKHSNVGSWSVIRMIDPSERS